MSSATLEAPLQVNKPLWLRPARIFELRPTLHRATLEYWGRNGRVGRKEDPDRPGYFLYNLRDVDRELARSAAKATTAPPIQDDRAKATLLEALRDYPLLTENFLRRHHGKHCPILGKRGPNSILRKLKKLAPQLDGSRFPFSAFARAQLKTITKKLKLAHDTKRWITATEAGIAVGTLIKLHHERKLTARRVWTIGPDGSVERLWQFWRETVEPRMAARAAEAVEKPVDDQGKLPVSALAKKHGVCENVFRARVNAETLASSSITSSYRDGPQGVFGIDPKEAAEIARRVKTRKTQPVKDELGWWIPGPIIATLLGVDSNKVEYLRTSKQPAPDGAALLWDKKTAWARGRERPVWCLQEDSARKLCGKVNVDAVLKRAADARAAEAKRTTEPTTAPGTDKLVPTTNAPTAAADVPSSPRDAFPAEHFKAKYGLEPDTLKKARLRGSLWGEKRGGRWFYSKSEVAGRYPDALTD